MSFFSYVTRAFVLIFVLLRQVRVRPGAARSSGRACPSSSG